MTVEDEMRDRIHRLIGRALIELSWQHPKGAAELLTQAVSHLRTLAKAAEQDQPT